MASSDSPPPTESDPNISTTNDISSTEQLYLIRLSQSHDSFRLAELESLAAYLNIPLKIHKYSATSPFCIISFPGVVPSSSTASAASISTTSDNATESASDTLAKQFISRSILSKAIYTLYATETSYPALHSTIQSLSQEQPTVWAPFEKVTFKFTVDAFRGKRSMAEQRAIVEGFRYLPFRGSIDMKTPQEHFLVFEEWDRPSAEEHEVLRANAAAAAAAARSSDGDTIAVAELMNSSAGHDAAVTAALATSQRAPRRILFGRYLASSQRHLAEKHDLKKRPYISTTSMDAELALITALLAHAAPGRLFLDPFVGTGGFMVAASELGAVTLGSDIDGRSFRGKGKGMEKGVLANFRRYGIFDRFGDCVTSDLTNTPFRVPRRRGEKTSEENGESKGRNTATAARWLDGIICDPPYGVREGLKVLGRRHHDGPSENGRTIHDGPYMVDGVPSHTLPGFIAPKRPYSFDRMLGDILHFAAKTLVDGGRLAFWMPCANKTEEDFEIPKHPQMELKHLCVQSFNKWSRRLLIYQRIPGEVVEDHDLVDGVEALGLRPSPVMNGHRADDLNQFRKMYFQGFSQNSSSTLRNGDG